MVSRTKRGNRTLYAISNPSVFELCDQVCGGLRRQVAELDAILPEPAGDAACSRLDGVRPIHELFS